MIGNGYIECKAQSNADFEQAEMINISNSYLLRFEPEINPYSNEKFSISTFKAPMPDKKDLICLYNAEDNTIRMLDSFNLRSDVYSRLYMGIDDDTLYFYDYKTRQYYCSEYPFDNATKYNGNRIPIFNRIRDLKLIELKSEYIIHNNQDLIYIDTTYYLCHYSVLTGKTISQNLKNEIAKEKPSLKQRAIHSFLSKKMNNWIFTSQLFYLLSKKLRKTNNLAFFSIKMAILY